MKRIIKKDGGIMFTATITEGEDGFFIARCVELDITTQGKTYEEAVANVKEMTGGYLEAFPDEISKIPSFTSTSVTFFSLPKNEITSNIRSQSA